MTLTLSGLTASQPYELYLYSSSLFDNDLRTTIFTIAGNSLTAANSAAPGVFIEGINYVHFGFQPANVAGQITIAIQGTGGEPIFTDGNRGGVINGFQIVPVPETASAALMASALIVGAIVLYKRPAARSGRTCLERVGMGVRTQPAQSA